MMQKLTAAQAIVRCLEIERITQAFCVPGESYLPIMNALYEHPTIRLTATRHESGAAFMAEGYAKASGKPAVVMATRAVGAANLSIGVHTAQQDSTPMIVFLGQVDSRFRGREGFQETDLERFFAPIAKWAVEVSSAERIPEIVQRAVRLAVTGRPGPVVVAFPEDVLNKEVTVRFSDPLRLSKPHPDDESIGEAVRLLANAERPLILAGGGIKWADAEDDLLRFSESTGIPVMASFRRHDVFPNHHPHYVGHLGLAPAKGIVETAKSAEVVLVLGSRLSEVTTQDYALFSANQQIIHIDCDASVVGKAVVPDLGIISDCRRALLALQNQAQGRIDPSRFTQWREERRKVYVQASTLDWGGTTELQEGLHPKAVIQALIEELPKDAIITNDAGNFAGWLHAYYPFTEKKTYVGPTSGAMGYGFPAALGVKMAQPNRVVVSLSGDGGFMMTMQELETAVRERLSVMALVFNNAMYGTIRMHQEKMFPNRVIATDLGSVDFAAVARAMNAESMRVQTVDDLRKALRLALTKRSDGPFLIDIKTDPEIISVGSTLSELKKRL